MQREQLAEKFGFQFALQLAVNGPDRRCRAAGTDDLYQRLYLWLPCGVLAAYIEFQENLMLPGPTPAPSAEERRYWGQSLIFDGANQYGGGWWLKNPQTGQWERYRGKGHGKGK